MFRMLHCKIECPGSILDGVTNVFALTHRLPKNHKGFFQELLMVLQERIPPRIIFNRFYLAPLKVPVER